MELKSIVFIAIGGLAILMSILGLPLPFMKKGDQCLTVFGYKADCSQSDYTLKTADLTCEDSKKRLQATTSFHFIGLIAMAVAMACCLIGTCMIRKAFFRWICIIGCIAAFVCFLINVAIEADFYNNKQCGQTAYKDQDWKLTSGFAFIVIAWISSAVCAVMMFAFPPEFEEKVE